MKKAKGEVTQLAYVLSSDSGNIVITPEIDFEDNLSKTPELNFDNLKKLRMLPKTIAKINEDINNIQPVSIGRATRPMESFLEKAPIQFIKKQLNENKKIISTNRRIIQDIIQSNRSGNMCVPKLYPKSDERLNIDIFIFETQTRDTVPYLRGTKFEEYLQTYDHTDGARVLFSIMKIETEDAIYLYACQVDAVVYKKGRIMNVEIKTTPRYKSNGMDINQGINKMRKDQYHREQAFQKKSMYIQGELGKAGAYVIGLYNNKDQLEIINVLRYHQLAGVNTNKPGSFLTDHDFKCLNDIVLRIK